jgi:hypothetical protein
MEEMKGSWEFRADKRLLYVHTLRYRYTTPQPNPELNIALGRSERAVGVKFS